MARVKESLAHWIMQDGEGNEGMGVKFIYLNTNEVWESF
jgi:hypothetical protein